MARAAHGVLLSALLLLRWDAATAIDTICSSISESTLRSRDLPIARLADVPCAASLEQAVQAALAVAMPLTKRSEYGGLILEFAGRYCYTTPVTSHQFHEVRYHADVPAGARIVALFHTHLRHDAARWFSEADIASAARFGVPSYIGIVNRGEVRVFDPSRMRGQRTVLLPLCGAVSRGELVQPLLAGSGLVRLPATRRGIRRNR